MSGLRIRVFISWAHDDEEHEGRVRRLYELLRQCGIDAKIDLIAASQPQEWAEWMMREIRSADYVLIAVSPAYRRRAEGSEAAGIGLGVRWEARILRQEFYADDVAARRKFLPVVLPGCSAYDIPDWLGGPVAVTHYAVSTYSVEGAASLLRYITNQPSHVEPALGVIPKLPLEPSSASMAEARVMGSKAGNALYEDDSKLQAQVRQFLCNEALGLTEDDLGVDLDDIKGSQRRIILDVASTVVEVRARLDGRSRASAESSLGTYLSKRAGRGRNVGVLTNGREWSLHAWIGERFQQIDKVELDLVGRDREQLLSWLEALLATGKGILPSPRNVEVKLGSTSPGYGLDVAVLSDLYERNRDCPTVRIKRQLWSRLLTTALGTNFQDEDLLFVNHTILVVSAKIIGHALLGVSVDSDTLNPAAVLRGDQFSDSDIWGVVEPDFFDWVVEVPGGEEFVVDIARRVSRFAWDKVSYDIMKVLYESIISRETRHMLGEYYTPGWLAEYVLETAVLDPLRERVLDPSCGSGTFLFYAIKNYLAAADRADLGIADQIAGLTGNIVGVDVHPVAVTLARVTYLLAIGVERIRAADRPAFAVPVYLGDSLRWGNESTLYSFDGLAVSTADDHELFANPDAPSNQRLRFPAAVVADAGRFDRLVNELADKATSRRVGTPPPSPVAIFDSYSVEAADRPVLWDTFRKLCTLHDEDRDHIWAYYIRNLARPLWLAHRDNRVDVIVGNPPWLAYRFMTRLQQISFKEMAHRRGFWRGASVATHQDLSALFVARCVEQYLRHGGRFAFVMPWAVLSRQQYQGFRTGGWSGPSEEVYVHFDAAIDLHMVKPSFFPVPACVIRGRRGQRAVQLSGATDVWAGTFDTASSDWSDAARHISQTRAESEANFRHSPYASRFSEGAALVPRVLFLVEDDDSPHLGAGAGRRAIRSRRSNFEKKPWRTIADQSGIVEEIFIRPCFDGSSLLPFRCVATPGDCVVPWDGKELLHGQHDALDRFRGLAKWWRRGEGIWNDNRSSDRLTLIEQADFRGKLSRQFPVAAVRLIYSKSGAYLAAAIVTDTSAVIADSLYWAPMATLAEARYLSAVLNSNALTVAVRPLQSRGEHNPRHFDKYIWRLPIPAFDPTDSQHRDLANLARRSEEIVARVRLPAMRFEAQRRRVRDALILDGVAAEIDALVKEMITA